MKELEHVEGVRAGILNKTIVLEMIKKGHIIIDPFNEEYLKGTTYYLHLNNKFRKPIPSDEIIDLSSNESIDSAFEPYKETDEYILQPFESVIAQTYESLGFSTWFRGPLENASRLGRAFINHASHGYIEAGHGIDKPFQLMLELTNFLPRPVRLVPKESNSGYEPTKVMRLSFEKLAYEADHSYQNTSARLKMDAKDNS